MLRGLAHYRVLRMLSDGAQGRVYLALDTQLQRRVAIKIYHLRGALSQRRHAVAEARRLARMESPRVVRIYDVVVMGRELALVMQYVPGCDLRALLAGGETLTVATAVGILTDLAEALAASRQLGSVHGDISASNVLIDTAGRATLCDFGVAAMAGDKLSGFNREALSPEQGRGEPASLQSDFFALGLLCYRMLFGRHPFFLGGRLDDAALQRGVLAVPAMQDVPAAAASALEGLLLDLLCVDPSRRPAGTFELREGLRQLRQLLPAPVSLRGAILSKSRGEHAAIGAPALPRALASLPWWRHAGAWLQRYWSGGSVGARATLAAAVIAVLSLMLLQTLRGGPCVALHEVLIDAPAGRLRLMPSADILQTRLAELLHEMRPDARVLCAGCGADSQLTLSSRGLRDVCVAQRSLTLSIRCDQQQCQLELRAGRQSDWHSGQLALGADAGLSDFLQALEQLARAQEVYLLR